jgi:hypothetical protein
MTPQLEIARENDAPPSEAAEHCIRRNPGAAIETTQITNLEGAKVAWSDVKNACEIDGLTITEVCERYKLKYPAVYARSARGKWKVVSSIEKRAKELQQRQAELTTTAAQLAIRMHFGAVAARKSETVRKQSAQKSRNRRQRMRWIVI